MLADELIHYRKQKGWSQEELAQQLGVTRQSISKWETGLATPDLDKIIQLSELYEVSLDTLVKKQVQTSSQREVSSRKVSLDDVKIYLNLQRRLSFWQAVSVALWILSPVCLFMMSDLDSKLVLFGIVILLILVGLGSSLAIYIDYQQKPWKFLVKEAFQLSQDGILFVEQKQKEFVLKHLVLTTLGILCLILSPIFIFVLQNQLGLSLLLVVVALGVMMLVYANHIQKSFVKLQQKKDDQLTQKQFKQRYRALFSIYWLVLVCLYLAINFSLEIWDKTWVIWPVGGIAFAILLSFLKMKNQIDD